MRLFDKLVPWLLIVTGFTGLVYQVVIGRLLTLHLGSSGASYAITLAAFLGGLAAGALLAGRASAGAIARMRRPMLAYAALEIGVGLWMLVFSSASDALFAQYHAWTLGTDPTAFGVVALKMACAALLILPLSTMLGATLPVLAACVERAYPARSVRLVSRYYYLNAAGASLGALVAGFYLIEQFGLDLPLLQGALANIAVGGLVWALFRKVDIGSRADSPADDRQGAPDDGVSVRIVVAAAGLTGFVTLVYEVIWTRLSGLLLGASVYAFALMLFVVIAGISVGSAVATGLLGRGRRPAWVFSVSQVLAGAAAVFLLLRLEALPIDLVRIRLSLAAVPENYGTWLFAGGGWVVLHYLPGAIALGASFPALLAMAAGSGARTDRATAWVLGSNTAGNLLGALLGGFVLMPVIGIYGVLVMGAAISIALASLTVPRPVSLPRLRLPLGTAAALGVLLLIVPPDLTALYRGLYRVRLDPRASFEEAAKAFVVGETAFRHDGPDASVTVDRHDENLLFRINGKTDGSTGDAVTQVMLGHLGFLFAPEAKDTLIVGLGTGQTAAAVAGHPVKSIVVAELIGSIAEVARRFSESNGNVMDDPRLRVVLADAREVLRHAPDNSYDIVVSEPSNPWVVGVADLYTVEHFERVKSRLRPRGVLVQWIHIYDMGDDLLRDILCTLQGVMPHIAVFRMEMGDLALVASPEPLVFDPDRVSAMFARGEMARTGSARVPRTMEQFMVTQLCGERTVARECQGYDEPLSERYPKAEYVAPRDMFAGTLALKFRGRLDTRSRGLGKADTWLGPWLAAHPLDDARRASLHRFLNAERVPGEQALRFATSPPAARRGGYCRAIVKNGKELIAAEHTVLGPLAADPDLETWLERCGR